MQSVSLFIRVSRALNTLIWVELEMVQMADWSNRRCLTNWAWMAVELSGFKPDKRAESYTFAQLENPRVRVFIPLKRLANTVQVAVTIAKKKKKKILLFSRPKTCDFRCGFFLNLRCSLCET